ncbi:MAG: cobalamin-dependent protein, partial [Pseudomonadota bacterium]
MTRMALLSTPWPLFNRPSIQLGALKAFVEREIPTVTVHAHHLYLTVAEALGYALYRPISEKTWLSESCYAALLYPERAERISRLWKRESAGLSRKWVFGDICSALKDISDRILAAIDWEGYFLVGISICLGQLTSALYFAREIKRRAPDSKILVGGSACSGEMGRSLLRAFAEIDFVISGEGERPLLQLVRNLQGGTAPEPDPFPGLMGRHQESWGRPEVFSQVAHLDELPMADYGDYFRHLNAMEPDRRFFPTRPMEMSRGCWWRKTLSHGMFRGCAFCNLNIQ